MPTQIGPDGRRYEIGSVPNLTRADRVPQTVGFYGQPEPGFVPVFQADGRAVWQDPDDSSGGGAPAQFAPLGASSYKSTGLDALIGSGQLQQDPNLNGNIAWFSPVDWRDESTPQAYINFAPGQGFSAGWYEPLSGDYSDSAPIPVAEDDPDTWPIEISWNIRAGTLTVNGVTTNFDPYSPEWDVIGIFGRAAVNEIGANAPYWVPGSITLGE